MIQIDPSYSGKPSQSQSHLKSYQSMGYKALYCSRSEIDQYFAWNISKYD